MIHPFTTLYDPRPWKRGEVRDYPTMAGGCFLCALYADMICKYGRGCGNEMVGDHRFDSVSGIQETYTKE